MKANQEGFAAVLAVLIAAVVLVGAGAYFYATQTAKPKPAPVTQNETAVEPATQASASNTVNWQAYSDKQYGFEIKYPGVFAEDKSGKAPFELDGIQTNFKLPSLVSAATFNLDGSQYKNTGFQFAYFNVGIDEDQKDAAACQDKSGKMVVINGITAYVRDLADDAAGGQRGTGYVYLMSTGGRCVVLHGFLAFRDSHDPNAQNPPENDILGLFNSIAGTFKINAQNNQSDTASWQTYSNDEHKIVIKIPSYFAELGYKININKPAWAKGCDEFQLSLKPAPNSEGYKKDPEKYVNILPLEICDKAIYCKDSNCQKMKECSRNSEPCDDDNFIFSKYLGENDNVFVFTQGSSGSGDPYVYNGWKTDEFSNVQNEMFESIKINGDPIKKIY